QQLQIAWIWHCFLPDVLTYLKEIIKSTKCIEASYFILILCSSCFFSIQNVHTNILFYYNSRKDYQDFNFLLGFYRKLRIFMSYQSFYRDPASTDGQTIEQKIVNLPK